MAWLDRTARTIFLWDFVKSFALAMRYFFAPKKTLNYPFERSPLSLAMVVVVAAVLQFSGLGPR